MKIIFVSFILLSGLFSAQTSLSGPTITDSIDLSKIYNSAISTPLKSDSIDVAISKFYKMPVSKPKDSSIYLSLKAPEKSKIDYKILNTFKPLKTKNIAAK